MVYTIILIALLSGMFGRMGGAGKSDQWYEDVLDTKWRDIGCSLLLILATIVLFGRQPAVWWAYALAFGLTWASFCTYWDKLFGYDCLWFSGLVVGVAGLPLMWVSGDLWWIWVVRMGVLAVVWELLNKKLPQKVWVWGRDVVEEFVRYFTSL